MGRVTQPLSGDPSAVDTARGPGLMVEERRCWIRTRTHTVVLERDPEFARFLTDPSGDVKRDLRVWIVRDAIPEHYLGSIRASDCDVRGFHSDLRRVLRRAASLDAADRGRALRRRVGELLRRVDPS